MPKHKPKKKRYTSLTQFHGELRDAGVKVELFDGARIVTKDAEYTLFDSTLFVKDRK